MDIKILEETGLSKREAKIYLKLLELGATTSGPLVDKTDVPSSKIYEVLNRLEEKGLVSHIIIKGKKQFQAANPDAILEQLDEKKKNFEKHLVDLKKLQAISERHEVEFYKGIPAIFSMIRQVINRHSKTDEYLSFSLGEEHKLNEVKVFFSNLARIKKDLGIKAKVLFSEENKTIIRKIYDEEILKIKNVRYTNIAFPQGTIIIGDTLILFEWEGEPSAVRIQSSTYANIYRKFFNKIYDDAKK